MSYLAHRPKEIFRVPLVDEELATTAVRMAATLEVHAEETLKNARQLQSLADNLRTYVEEDGESQ